MGIRFRAFYGALKSDGRFMGLGEVLHREVPCLPVGMSFASQRYSLKCLVAVGCLLGILIQDKASCVLVQWKRHNIECFPLELRTLNERVGVDVECLCFSLHIKI